MRKTSKLSLNVFTFFVFAFLATVPAFAETKNLAKVKQVYFSFDAKDANLFALLESGELWSWGQNLNGSLGLGISGLSSVAQRVEIPGKVIDFRTSEGSLALTDQGTLWSWGQNYNGRLGQPLNQVYDKPTQVQIPEPVAEIVTNGQWQWSDQINLAISKSRNLYQLGVHYAQTVPPAPEKVNLPGRVSNAYVFSGSFYAILEGGDLWTWGYNGGGQLGLGHKKAAGLPTHVDLPAPVLKLLVVGNAETFTEVEYGGVTVFATLLNGEIWAWGSNADGVLGSGNDTDRPVPQRVPVEAGSELYFHQHSWHQSLFAVTPKGELFAWGANYRRNLGICTDARHEYHPTQVILPSEVKQLALKQRTSVYALLKNGEVWNWGTTSEGGGETNIEMDPHVVFSDSQSKVSRLLAPGPTWVTSFFYIFEDTRVFAWGYNRLGQLGLARGIPNVVTPELVPFDRIQDVWASEDVTCVVDTGRLLRCLGNNQYGQLGQGHTNPIDPTIGFGDIEPINF